MENKKRKILIVEDDKIDRMAFERFVNEEKLPYNYIFAESVKEAKKFLEKEIFDAVLADYRLGDGTAFDLFDKVETFPFIIVTGTGDEEIAVKAMKSGAYDYLIKDAEGNYLKILPVTVDNAIKHKLAEEASKRTEEEILLKHKQLLSIFDSIDEVIYVADPTTYELLYFNEAFKSRWKVNVGDKCYKVLQNQTSPCSFCSNKYIFGENLGKTYIWEWQNLVDRHWYRCIDRAIKWPDGRMVRYEMAIDVTERKQTEEALRQAEQKYRNIFENAVIGIHQSTLDGRFLMVNQTAARIHGYDSPEEMMAMVTDISRQAFVKPGRRAEFIRLVQEHGSVSNFEYQVYRKDGSTIWISANARGVYDANGKLVGFEGTSIDITDRKHEEEKRERIERIVDNSQVILFHWLAEPGWPVSFVSEGISQFGYTTDDFYSRRLDYAQIVYPEDLPRVADEVKAYLESRTDRFTQEYRIVTKSGDVRWLDDRTLVVRDQAGNIQHIEGTVLDVTERKQAEEKLRKSEERYRTLVENLTVGVYRNTADPHGRFVQANFAIAKMFGYDSVDEFMRIKVPDLYQESEDRKLFVEAITQTGSVTNKELRLKKKDGTPIWASVSARAHYDEKGNIDWMDGVIEDITERKHAEEELQKRLRELELYYNITIGRESRIIELKHQVNELLERLGEKKKYKV